MTATAPRPDRAADSRERLVGALRGVLDDVLAATAVGEAELVALVERCVAEAWARVHAEESPAGIVARFDIASGALRLDRLAPGDVLPEALELDPETQRQAAAGVRGAVAGLLREAERTRVVRAGDALRGELVDAIVERTDGELWWLRVDGMPALLPPEEQVAGDVLERNRHVKVLVLETRRRVRDAVLVVSRSHPHLLRRLLEQEVPEMGSGQVQVRALVRDPGRRSKVAVEAVAPGVDPEGACIGPRGVRIRAVVADLGEEQVHVVGWSDDPAVLVERALGPAAVTGVELDEASRTAHVTVPTQQLSLAIGRAGENARLAARLTGWRIDIRGEEGGG